jgi:ADP-dependent NAD(P)H-hydrate dehydratase
VSGQRGVSGLPEGKALSKPFNSLGKCLYRWISSTPLTDDGILQSLPARRRSSRKGENGRVLVVGGSSVYHGAPVHAARGAQSAGVDLVYLAVPKVISTPVRSMSADFIVFPLPDSRLTGGSVRRLLNWLPQVDSAVIGPGLERPEFAALKRLCSELLARSCSLVLDAGALLPELAKEIHGEKVVLTPHAGEFKRLTGVDLPTPAEQRAPMVREWAERLQSTLLQKGMGDVISDGRDVYLNFSGRAAMTAGGTGDVLAGLTAGLLALGVPTVKAAAISAYLNGLAGTSVWGRVGNRLTAELLALELRNVFKRFEKEDVE